MEIGLFDFNWTGHHTPYASYISRSLIDLGHSVTFVTDEAHPNTDVFPDGEDFSLFSLDVAAYKYSPGTEFKVNEKDGFVGSIAHQWNRTKQLRRIFGEIPQLDLDILHMLYFEGSQIPTRLATAVGSRKLPELVVTLHRDAFTGAAENVPSRLTRSATISSINSCLSDGTISCITVHSERSRERIIDTVTSATSSNVRTYPAPTPEASQDLEQEEVRQRLGLPADVPVVLFFGELRHEKGPDILYEAVDGFDRPLAVVYAGPEYDYSTSDVSAWSDAVDDPVEILNRVEYVPEEKVNDYFVASDALVVPYRRTRGISGPLRRACMTNRHVIGPNDSDVGDIIERHHLGQTFERESPAALQETLAEFLDNRDRYPLDGVSEYGEQLHWHETGRTLQEIYRSSLEHSA